jgi:hypothetical protein
MTTPTTINRTTNHQVSSAASDVVTFVRGIPYRNVFLSLFFTTGDRLNYMKKCDSFGWFFLSICADYTVASFLFMIGTNWKKKTTKTVTFFHIVKPSTHNKKEIKEHTFLHAIIVNPRYTKLYRKSGRALRVNCLRYTGFECWLCSRSRMCIRVLQVYFLRTSVLQFDIWVANSRASSRNSVYVKMWMGRKSSYQDTLAVYTGRTHFTGHHHFP